MNAGHLLQMSGVIVDLIYKVDTVPAAGDEAIVRGFSITAGGGFNAMIAARRAGMAVSYGGGIGTGPFGTIVTDALVGAGIAALRKPSPEADQGCCTVMVDSRGERTFVAAEGADGIAAPADLSGIDLARFDCCLLSGYALGYPRSRDALTGWLSDLADGAPLVFDPSPLVNQIPDGTLRAVMSKARWISANAREARHLTGRTDPADAASALAAGRSDRGGAVVRDGANGCFVAEAGRRAVHVPGFAARAVDTNGAGDTHIGAFIAALSRGGTPGAAARYANAAAALSTLQEGPATAPLHDDVLGLLGPAPLTARTG